ncbi:hypothetical protein Hanom_Chr00s000003g01602481 [Helianthus anomalus]
MHVTHSLLSIIFLYKGSFFSFHSSYLHSLVLYFQTTLLMYLSLKSLLLNSRHLFIKDKRK